jgi:hypothetical protein
MPPSAICWSICCETPSLKYLEANRSGSSSAGLPWRLRRLSQETSSRGAVAPGHQQGAHGLAALLPQEDAEHDAAHAQYRKDRTARVDATRSRVRHVAHELDAGEHDRNDEPLDQERDAPGQVRGDEPAEQQRPTAAAIAAAAPTMA